MYDRKAPRKKEFDKLVTVRFSLPKLTADRWPVERIRQTVIDLDSGNVNQIIEAKVAEPVKSKIDMLKASIAGVTTANKLEELQDKEFKAKVNQAFGPPASVIMPRYSDRDQQFIDLALSVYNHKHVNGDGRKAIISYLNQLKQQADDTFIE